MVTFGPTNQYQPQPNPAGPPVGQNITPGFGHPGKSVPGVTPYWLTTGAPQRVFDYRDQVLPLLREQTMGALGQNMATQGAIFRDSQRQMGDQFAQLGINPAAVAGRFMPQMQMGFAEQLGGAAAGARGQLAQGQMDLAGEVLSALNQIEAYYDSIGQQKYAADKSAKASSKAAGIGGFASVLGGVGSMFGL
jgi:hypothetical protein